MNSDVEFAGLSHGTIWTVKNLQLFCYLSPKWTILVCPFFWRKKEILPLMGGNLFSTEQKCYLMGQGEYGVKVKTL